MTDPNTPQQRQVADDEIDLRELFSILWKGKWIIIAVTFVFAVGSVIYALSLPNIYAAEAKLAPTKEAQGSGLGNMGGQLGGLASLAGINMPQGQVDNARLAQEILRSRAFITNFVQEREVLPDLMAVESWHPISGEVTYDYEIYNPETQTWVREVEPPKQPKPTAWEFVDEFRDIMNLTEDTTTGVLTLRIEHLSPVIAKQWVDWLIEDINNEMRRRDIEEAQRSISYIERELENARLANTQQVYSSLLEQQTQTIMLANVRPEYVYRVIDPAVVPEQRAKPSRALIAIVGTFLGGFLSLFIVLLLNVIRKGNEDSPAKLTAKESN
ncbi:Wzz/FepE/Etk N-terminal domain-containing protein [Aliidiomarina maris]|uniref:LPS O-antigen length regulator n=1 Tax=Aliidiomarina maris TaxID=531312 RepID=A0A327WP52_9GAMM|nr:Wzz/FepE/Etk N-terminal domain-containing protein [Aliidiomarina maris]RAJ93641.1 LPS O-antigen subunit length determinant protein (WzzB/FepE family) [Aliidiomarina maris]RUO19090.1 LPS O-antigen length regulator [Aliidiomarina maris]